jgi:hypothetical protein
MHTITTKNKWIIVRSVAKKARKFWRMLQHSEGSVNTKNFPTIILTEIRRNVHSQTIGDLRLHSSARDILQVEKPTWAEWREQMSHIKKAKRLLH